MASTISPEAAQWKEETYSLFFYGTLLHPAVLKRVIGHGGDTLHHRPAILLNYTRHHVKGDTYPAMLPWDKARELFLFSGQDPSKEPTPEQRSVRGSLVSGFSKLDVELLDVFEGDEYERCLVSVVPLGTSRLLNEAASDAGVMFESMDITSDDQPQTIKAHTYIWNKPPAGTLEPEIWSYETFVRENLHHWIGAEGKSTDVDRTAYLEVDQWREQNKKSEIERRRERNMSAMEQRNTISAEPEVAIARALGAPVGYAPSTVPEAEPEYNFGHGMLPYFCFEKGYINLNNGSYGSVPKPVVEACRKIQDTIESRPDHFMRIELEPAMDNVRNRLAKVINARDVDEVVLVPNTTHGVNVVLNNLRDTWTKDDALIGFTTTYGAVAATLRRYTDATPHPALHTINLTFPTTPDKIVKSFKEFVQATFPGRSLDGNSTQQVVAIIDGIISVPGVRLPWEELVKICREYGIISIVDAAHVIGQVPLDVQKVDPDYLITNCHKWLYAHRACAILYAPQRNHHKLRCTFPVSWGYKSPPEEFSLAELYQWTGTADFTPYLSINAALDFRERIGGEERIQSYCHDLACKGGARMAEILGTELLDKDHLLTACMVNVRLPFTKEEAAGLPPAIVHDMMQRLLKDWHCAASVYGHGGYLWVRGSAQIWLEVSDFEYTAMALKSICDDLRHTTNQKVQLDAKAVEQGTAAPPAE